MLQLKLYRKHDTTPEDLSALPAVSFQNPNLLGVRFAPDPRELRDVSLRAAKLALRPVLLGEEAFLHLVEVADQTGLSVTQISFDPPLDEEEAEELGHHIMRVQAKVGMAGLQAFVRRVLAGSRSVIKSVVFLAEAEAKLVKVTLFDNGIVYLNDGDRVLSQVDYALSRATHYWPGYHPA